MIRPHTKDPLHDSYGAFGKLGALLYYMTTSLLAILGGLVIVNRVAPGMVDGEPAKQLAGLSENTAGVVTKVEGKGVAKLVGIFLHRQAGVILSFMC